MSAPAPLFHAEGLDVVLDGDDPKEILSDASFAVYPAAFTGLIGETGSGKSVSLRASLQMLPKALRLTSGSSYFEEQRMQDLSPKQLRAIRGREIAFIPQQPWSALNPVQTIEQQFIDIAKSHGKSASWARRRAGETLERVGIPHVHRVMRGYVGGLSGGMAQRVLIAMAILLSPRLIVADEPTTALDVTVQREILELLHSLCTEDSMGVLIVTHDLGVVSNFCDHVYVMNAGVILESGRVDEVFANPSNEYTQKLVDASSRHLRADDFSAQNAKARMGGSHG
jgi:ABC-type dipeptide/oligopeptide/nickel transport system ATPase component